MQDRGKLVSAGMAAQAESGFLIGKARLGYRSVRTEKGTVARIDGAIAPSLRQAFAMAADGVPLRAVTASLNAHGVKGSRGGPVSLSTVQRALTDPYYAGLVRNAAGRYAPGAHEPLVTPELFRAVQRKLAARRCLSAKQTGRLYL